MQFSGVMLWILFKSGEEFYFQDQIKVALFMITKHLGCTYSWFLMCIVRSLKTHTNVRCKGGLIVPLCAVISQAFFQRCDPEILSPQTITAIQQLRARPVRTFSNLPSSHQPTRLNTTSTQSLITTITPALLNVRGECIQNVLCVQFTGITALSCPSHQPQSFQTFPHTGMPVKIV